MEHNFSIKLQAIVICAVLIIGIFLPCMMQVFAEVLIDADTFEDSYYKPATSSIGYQIDAQKNYEIVDSTLFNKAGQEVWNLTKIGKMTAVAGQIRNGHRTVELTSDGSSKGGEVYFWNEKAPALPEEKLEGRTTFGKLFPGFEPTRYTGIRLYVEKEQTAQAVGYQILLGKMSKGYWPSAGFYICDISLPKKAYSGYVYLRFSDFVNSKGNVLDASDLNFIAFKYKLASPAVVSVYFGELGLWREGSGGVLAAGDINIGVGEQLNLSSEYMFYDSPMFNRSDEKDWSTAKLSGFTVTPGYTKSGYFPSDADSSIRLTTTGASKYSEAFFWRQFSDGTSRPKGVLFGTNINITDYDGIRLWVKADESNPYALVTVMTGSKAYYQSEAQGGYYSYSIVIEGGFEGYVNIPFKNFVNLKGEALPVADLNFIAFKHGEGSYAVGDIYFSNLQLYGLKANDTYVKPDIGVQLNADSRYELVSSLVFQDASQAMWDQTKAIGIIATAGVSDKGYIPELGKTSVKIHTTGEKASPEIYYWNELSDGGRRTHARFWGNTDCTEYEGIRLWIKIDENNTYSKLTVYLGQMYTGYWPKEEVGFFGYNIVIPRGGFEGYVNIPFSYFKNKAGEVLGAANLNFIAFKYNETGFKETDIWISDLTMYRKAGSKNVTAGNSIIVDGSKLQVAHISADGTVTDTIGDEYSKLTFSKSNEKEIKADTKTTSGWYAALFAAIAAFIAALAVIIIILIMKNRKRKER